MSYIVPDFVMPGVLEWEERKRNIEHAMSLGLPFLEIQPERKGHVTLACYGPSLKQTYFDIGQPFISVSGAHDWLIDRNRVPTYHVECDPRPHKAGMLTKATDKTKYLIASVCHPDVFKALEGRDVSIWHLGNGPQSEEYHSTQQGLLVGGGSTAGLRAIEIAHILGYRSLEIHGMDCSFGEQQWAGPHTGKKKTEFMVNLHGKNFRTSSLMVQAAREFIHTWRTTPTLSVRLKGDGLLREMMKEVTQPLRRAA